MKTIRISLAILVAALIPVIAAEPTEADQRWAKAVEQKIAAGPAVVTTPSEVRANLAKAIAAKLGRQATVTKTTAGYSVDVRGTETTQK
jgi:hypothetical protein